MLAWATLEVSIRGGASEPKRTLGLVRTNCCFLEGLLGSIALSLTGFPFSLDVREGRWGSVSAAGVVELASLRGSNTYSLNSISGAPGPPSLLSWNLISPESYNGEASRKAYQGFSWPSCW